MKLNLNTFKLTINQTQLNNLKPMSQKEPQIKASSSLSLKDSIALNQTTSKVDGYRSVIKAELDREEEKVQQIKALIKSGNYPIHTESIAKAMMDASRPIDSARDKR